MALLIKISYYSVLKYELLIWEKFKIDQFIK